MLNAFVCFRPYQLLTILNMVQNGVEGATPENSVLFLADFPRVEAVVAEEALEPYFFRVVVCQSRRITKREIFSPKICFQPRKYMRLALSLYGFEDWRELSHFDKIFSSGWNSFFCLLHTLNPSVSIIMLEDGLAAYVNEDQRVYWDLKAKIYNFGIWLMFRTGPLAVHIDGLYVYQPNLLLARDKRKYFIRQLPAIDGEVVAKARQVFKHQGSCDVYKGKKIIFLSQPLGESGVGNFDETPITKLIEHYSPDYVYRKHPNQRDVTNAHLDTSNSMWELLINDLDEGSLLVSYFSTALFTPYILYQRKNPIVLLYKLIFTSRNRSNQQLDEFNQKFMEIFPGKVYVPNNLEELENVLKQWQEGKFR